MLMAWSFWDREKDVGREEAQEILGLLVGLSAQFQTSSWESARSRLGVEAGKEVHRLGHDHWWV